jgi:NadR type nicotinamide-nucleotide adenylyltransferase
MQAIKKIVVIGPESTGKSTLCELLARHYQTAWVPEYAREFLLASGKRYDYEQLLEIARGQIALEDKISFSLVDQESAPFAPTLFIDTDMYVMKVWSEFVFGKCHQWIIDQIVERKYDLYLLCNTDLPWVKDELREYPDYATRERLFHMYKDIMVNQNTPWIEIRGGPENRFGRALEAVDALIQNNYWSSL